MDDEKGSIPSILGLFRLSPYVKKRNGEFENSSNSIIWWLVRGGSTNFSQWGLTKTWQRGKKPGSLAKNLAKAWQPGKKSGSLNLFATCCKDTNKISISFSTKQQYNNNVSEKKEIPLSKHKLSQTRNQMHIMKSLQRFYDVQTILLGSNK